MSSAARPIERRASEGAARPRAHARVPRPARARIDEPTQLDARHARPRDLVARRRGSPPGSRSRPSIAAASRSCARPVTTRCADRAMGFCLVNNVAIAARYAQAELGVARVAIVDFDVHHGNGTEASLSRRRLRALRARCTSGRSIPGTGGPGTSDETTLNLPLPAGTGDAGVPRRLRGSRRAGGAGIRPGAPPRLGRLRRPRGGSARRARADRRRVPRARRAAVQRSSRRASPPCSRVATTSRRCRGSWPRRTQASPGASRARARAARAPRGARRRRACAGGSSRASGRCARR